MTRSTSPVQVAQRIPGSPGAVQTAFGLEWRQDNGNFKADDYLFTGDTLGYGGSSPVVGSEDVYEVYGEMLIPLADGAAFADYLALEIGGRYADYEHAGSADTMAGRIRTLPFRT